MGHDEDAQAPRQAPFTDALETWVCYPAEDPLAVYLTAHPERAPSGTRCTKLTDLETTAKTVYYVSRTLSYIEQLFKNPPLP